MSTNEHEGRYLITTNIIIILNFKQLTASEMLKIFLKILFARLTALPKIINTLKSAANCAVVSK